MRGGDEKNCSKRTVLGSRPGHASTILISCDTCVLRLTHVRAQPQASISVTRVCIVFHATAYALFSGSSLQAESCERVANSLTVLAESITLLSIGVVGNCLIGLLIGLALQPARVPSHSAPVIPTREDALRPEPGICGCGPCICGEPRASQRQWTEVAREGGASLYNLIVGLVIGVCTGVTLYCTQRGVSREILVATEQLRSLLQGFRLIRQPLRA